ncbi:MAG: CDP-diacylglycerol--glycerol-3-phosphate 3-phosphatidyltransferase [Planctomycetota bacterium]
MSVFVSQPANSQPAISQPAKKRPAHLLSVARSSVSPASETSTSTAASTSPWNVPNAITAVRFVLAIAVMVLIPLGQYFAALLVFALAASTDWMDGYWARKYGQVTKLGRIFDPFVDKIIICGSFIALVEMPDSPVSSWMATLVVARELLVTSLRGLIEGAGGDFSANQLGKWKMVAQCAAVIAVLLMPLSQALWVTYAAMGLLWAAIALTIYSGYVYVLASIQALRED